MAGAVPQEKQSNQSYEDEHLGPYMGGDADQQFGWFQSKGLLATSKTCPACSQPMDMQTRSDVLTSTGGDVVTLPVGRYLDEFMWRERPMEALPPQLWQLQVCVRILRSRYPV